MNRSASARQKTQGVVGVVSDAEVQAALSRVRDPELDEPITDLGFVTSIEVSGADAHIRLRLPTAFCAPNFAYLMAADSLDAVRSVPGIGRVSVLLDGNTDSDRINAGLAAGLGFAETYPEEADNELEELRRSFQAKAHLASIERLVTVLVRDFGVTVPDLSDLRIGGLPDVPAAQALRHRRADLGLDASDEAWVLVTELGERWDVTSLEVQLRFAKATRISIDGNAHFCRGLLRTRYPESTVDQRPREQDLALNSVRDLLPLSVRTTAAS